MIYFRVFELEDVNRNMISNEHVFKHTLSRGPSPFLARTLYSPAVEWYWKCLVAPLALRCAAAIAAIMSVLVIWSEVIQTVEWFPANNLFLCSS